MHEFALYPLVLHDPALTLVFFKNLFVFSIYRPHLRLLVRVQYYLERMFIHFETFKEPIDNLMHAFGSSVTSHGVHPHKVLLFTVPNILSLCILTSFCLEIIEEKVKRFDILCADEWLSTVVKVYEVVRVCHQ